MGRHEGRESGLAGLLGPGPAKPAKVALMLDIATDPLLPQVPRHRKTRYRRFQPATFGGPGAGTLVSESGYGGR